MAHWQRPSGRLVIVTALLLLLSPSRTLCFAPLNTRDGSNNRSHLSRWSLSNERSTAATPPWRPRALHFSSDPARTATATTTPSTANGFRGTALFARGPGRPRKDAAAVLEEDDDALDYEDAGAEEPEEEEVVDEDIEIGIGDDEEEEEEDETEFEYEEELEEEEYDEGKYSDEEISLVELAEAESATNAEVWASYDATAEEPAQPLLDDVESNPHYRLARDAVLSQVDERKRLAEQESRVPRNLETMEDIKKTLEYIANDMTNEERQELEEDADLQEVDRLTKDALLTEKDLEGILIEDEEGNRVIDPEAIKAAGSFRDDRGVEAFPSSTVEEDGENLVYPADGTFTEHDLVELDDQMAAYENARAQLENQTYFGEGNTMAHMDPEREWLLQSPQNQAEMLDVMDNSTSMACADPDTWLMYDQGFNVTNLILASFKDAAAKGDSGDPIMFTQWMPQLEVYERYADQRDKNFEWTWDDVEVADMDELRRYYKGIGYDKIPEKPDGGGYITLDESPMDDDEREMLALENWMDEVYQDEREGILPDDKDFQPSDNVYDPTYHLNNADRKKEEKEIEELGAFMKEFGELQRYANMTGEGQKWVDDFATVEYEEEKEDLETKAAYRGWLVVACSPEEKDLDDATRIAARCKEEFGKAVVVETRVLGHAKKSDNVFEVWLESFDIDLLHSRRRAYLGTQQWTGPGEVDEKQLEYIVETVRYLISEEARLTERYSDDDDLQGNCPRPLTVPQTLLPKMWK